MVNIIEPPTRILPILGVNCNQEKSENLKIMTAKAVLQCRPHSYPFPERTLFLSQPVKIGRSVAKAKPAANNAIFDCKVLSRNHAILFYENGKFYLKDTKSSNGTFVNNQRLSKGSEESIPREVCSSDIVQFGVDVVEDFKKVAHGCVIATLKLYLPDGQEAKSSSITAESGSACSITLQEFHVLRRCLEEASHREQQINAKLATLLNSVNSAQEVAFQGWTTMVDEDILLQRLELLQGQLATFSKNYPEGDAKSDVRQLQEDKGQIEINAKQSIAKILKEKFDIEIQCADLERKASSVNIELESLKDILVSYKTEIDELLQKQDVQTCLIQELADQAKTAEEELKNKDELGNDEINEEIDLVVTVEKLKTENDLVKKQCNVIKYKYENLKNANRLSEIEVEGPVADANHIYETLRHTLKTLRDKFREAQEDTPDIQDAISCLSRDLEQASIEDAKCKTEKTYAEEELLELKGKLKADASIEEHFQNVETASYKKLTMFLDGVLAGKNTISKAEIIKDIENNQTNECTLLKTVENSCHSEDKNETHLQLCIYVVTSLQDEIRKASEAIRQSKNSQESTEEKLDLAQKKYSQVSEALVAANYLSSSLRQRLATKQELTQNKATYLNDVLDRMTQLESTSDHIHSQFYSLANNLTKEREESDNLRNEVNSIKSKLDAAEKLSQTVAQEAGELTADDSSNSSLPEETLEANTTIIERTLECPTAELPIVEAANLSDAEKSSSVCQHTKENAVVDQPGNAITICRASEKEHPLDDSLPVLDKMSQSLDNPTDSLEDRLSALKRENNRLRSQLNIQNEEFSDLAMRNQIVLPTWYLTLIIGFLYYSWSFYCYFF